MPNRTNQRSIFLEKSVAAVRSREFVMLNVASRHWRSAITTKTMSNDHARPFTCIFTLVDEYPAVHDNLVNSDGVTNETPAAARKIFNPYLILSLIHISEPTRQ